MTPAEIGFPEGGEAWPLWTVTLDGRPVSLVRAVGHGEAVNIGEAFAIYALYGPDPETAELHPLSNDDRLRLAAREPTEEERAIYNERSGGHRQVPAVGLPWDNPAEPLVPLQVYERVTRDRAMAQLLHHNKLLHKLCELVDDLVIEAKARGVEMPDMDRRLEELKGLWEDYRIAGKKDAHERAQEGRDL